MRKELKSISCIQNVCRIFHAKRQVSILKMAKDLNNAMRSRDINLLSDTIKASSKHLAKVDRRIKNLSEKAREVLGELYDEQELKTQTLDAIADNDVEMLEECLEKGKLRQMLNEPEMIHAKKLHTELVSKGKATERLWVLTYGGNFNAVLENADELKTAIESAKKCNCSPKDVERAEKYFDKVQSLLPVRNKMRIAVEIASRNMILEALEERKEFCRTHGNDFCREEKTAMENMLRMFSYERQLKGGDTIAPPPAEKGGNPGVSDRGFDDVRLPTWAFKQLLTIQNSQDDKSKEAETISFQEQLGDDLEKMNEIRRVFKWVVHYSTWRHPDHEAQIEMKYQMQGILREDGNMTVGAGKHKNTLRSKTSPTKKKKKEDLLVSGSSTRDKSKLKAAVPKQRIRTKKASSGYSQGRTKIEHKKTTPKSDRKLKEMMKEYATFYDTHRIPLDWCP